MLFSLLVLRVVSLIRAASGFVPVVSDPKAGEGDVCTLVEAFIKIGLRLARRVNRLSWKSQKHALPPWSGGCRPAECSTSLTLVP